MPTVCPVPGSRARNGAGNDGERDVPPAGTVTGHAERLHVIRHRPRPAEPDPARFRDLHLGVVPVQAADVTRLDSDDPESLVTPGLPPCQAAVRSGEEVPHGLVVVPDGLLLHDDAALGQPGASGAGLGQLPAALREPGHLPASGPPCALLFDAKVPDEPGVGAVPEQGLLLLDGGLKTVPGHANILS